MASTYFTKLTLYGAAQIAAATAGAPINLVAMAIGDGGGSETTPSELQTQLVSETYRATLNRLVVDAKAATKLIAELIIPESAGGWTMREVGIYDDKGQLFAVANTPPSYKPQTSEGSAKTQVVRIVIKVSSTANVTIFNDPSTVIATVEHVTDQFAARNVSAGTGLAGGGSLSSDIELNVKFGDTDGTAAAGNDPRLVNAILKSMLAQDAGFAFDVPMSQNAVTAFVDHKFGVLQLYVAFNFINNERVKQASGTSESDLMSQDATTKLVGDRFTNLKTYLDSNFASNERVKQVAGSSASDLMSQKATTDLKENALGKMGQMHTANAVFTAIDNKIFMPGIVSELSLEVGDVIQFTNANANNNKPRTVESINGAGEIVVNYEHCGARGNGPLKLTDETKAGATVKLLAKYFVAPPGLGQAWCSVTRSTATLYANPVPREIKFSMSTTTAGNSSFPIKVEFDDVSVDFSNSSVPVGVVSNGYACGSIPPSASYKVVSIHAIATFKEFR